MDDDSTSNVPRLPDAVLPTHPGGGEDTNGDVLGDLLGGLDMGSLLSMAGDMQKQMAQAQQRAANTEVEGSSGGGAVRVTMTGAFECTGVTINPDAADDMDLLGDLVVAAVRDAVAKARAVGGDDPLSGLGDLGDLFGG